MIVVRDSASHVVTRVDRAEVVTRAVAPSVVSRSVAPGIVTRPARTAIVTRQVSPAVVSKTRPRPLVVASCGRQGPEGVQGVPGPPGGQIVQITAGAALSGHRAVYVGADEKLYYASAADNTARLAQGILTNAPAQGALGNVQLSGVLVEPSWSWQMDEPVFLGIDGLLTQTPPTTGQWLIVIGIPEAPDTLNIRISTSIELLV